MLNQPNIFIIVVVVVVILFQYGDSVQFKLTSRLVSCYTI